MSKIKQEQVQVDSNTRYLRCFGHSDSHLGSIIKEANLPEHIEISYRSMFPEVLITLSVSASPNNKAKINELYKIQQKLEEKIGKEIVFADSPDSNMATVLGNLLIGNNKTLALAESCSGGMLANDLVSIAGASKFLVSSVVSYSNEAKSIFLGVRPAIISSYGAVSSQTAIEMARGAMYRTGANYGLSITGVAGPDGGTEDKPIGTFFVGLCTQDKELAFEHFAQYERNMFRRYSATLALDILRREILQLPLT